MRPFVMSTTFTIEKDYLGIDYTKPNFCSEVVRYDGETYHLFGICQGATAEVLIYRRWSSSIRGATTLAHRWDDAYLVQLKTPKGETCDVITKRCVDITPENFWEHFKFFADVVKAWDEYGKEVD